MSTKYYQLVRDDVCLYVGVTTQHYLCNRLTQHKQHLKVWKDGDTSKGKLFYFSDDFTFDGVQIKLIESIAVEMSTQEKRERENYWIEKLNPSQNQNRLKNPNYQKEWWEEHKEEQALKKKEYYQTTLKAKQKTRVNCPICGLEVAYSSLSKHKSRKHSE